MFINYRSLFKVIQMTW